MRLIHRYLLNQRPANGLGQILRGLWLSSLRRCWLLYLIALVVFGSGLFWGVESASRLEKTEAAQLEEFISPLTALGQVSDKDKKAIFRQAALRNTLPLGMMYVAGLTVIGMPVVAGVLFLRGYALGFTGGFLVQSKGAYGFGLILAEIFPQNVILLAVFIVGAVASLSFSLLLIRRGFHPDTAVFPWFLRYTGMMALLAAAALGAGVIEAYAVPGVAGVVLPLLE